MADDPALWPATDLDEQDGATCRECGAHDDHPNHLVSGCPYGLVGHASWCPNRPADPTNQEGRP